MSKVYVVVWNNNFEFYKVFASRESAEATLQLEEDDPNWRPWHYDFRIVEKELYGANV